MAAAIVLRRDLDVEVPDLTIHVAVLDPNVRKVDPVIEVRKVVFARPLLDFLATSIRPPVTVPIATVALLQELLVLAFQLAVELHPQNLRVAFSQPVRLAQVRTI